ncbi:MAG: M23 family metallopeptidase [Armatimonadota bacterium]
MKFPTYSLLSLAFGLLLVALLAVPARMLRGEEPVISVKVLTPEVVQGGTAFLLIDTPNATGVRIRDGEKDFPAERREDGRWEALIGVWREAAPGTRTVTIEANAPGWTTTALASFRVRARTFPIQRLRMSSSQSSKYEEPEVEEEYRLIGKAINLHTPRRWQGAFRLPCAGRVSTVYGVQRYRNGERVGIHKGIDISAGRGAPVYAANAGTVVLRRSFLMHGRTLVVDHGGGVAGIYLHLNDFGASEGQQVKAGQLIARVGSTGAATGPHLHYALYIHGTAIDPLLWRSLPAGW